MPSRPVWGDFLRGRAWGAALVPGMEEKALRGTWRRVRDQTGGEGTLSRTTGERMCSVQTQDGGGALVEPHSSPGGGTQAPSLVRLQPGLLSPSGPAPRFLAGAQPFSPESQRSVPEPPAPHPVPQASAFSVNQKVPSKVKPSRHFVRGTFRNNERVHGRHGHLPPERAPFISTRQAHFCSVFPLTAGGHLYFKVTHKHQPAKGPGPSGQVRDSDLASLASPAFRAPLPGRDCVAPGPAGHLRHRAVGCHSP